MLVRNDQPDGFSLDFATDTINCSFAVDSVFIYPGNQRGTVAPVPINNLFLLLDNTNFLLLDGTNLLLLGT